MSTITPTSFTLGDTVYSIGGHKATYVSALPSGGHIVRPLYDAYCGGGDDVECHEEEGNLTEWPSVYLNPPTELLHAEVAALDAQLVEKQAELDEARKQQRELDEAMKARKDRIEQHEGLRELDAYLAGKITHYVITGGDNTDLRIITQADEKEKGDEEARPGRGSDEYRILTLKIENKWGGGVSWRLGGRGIRGEHYSEQKISPCLSREEAVTKATAIYEANLAKWRKERDEITKKNGGRSYFSIQSSAIRYQAAVVGLPIPEDIIAYDRAAEQTAAQAELVIAERELVKARERIEKARS